MKNFFYIPRPSKTFYLSPPGPSFLLFSFLQPPPLSLSAAHHPFQNEYSAMENPEEYYIQFRFRMVRIISKRRFSSVKEFQLMPEKKLGCGSFGTVTLARHKNTSRMYAIKMVNIKELPTQTQLKLVQRQIKLHCDIDHPHIIKLWDTLFEGDTIYMIMEYADNGNLFYYQNSKGIFGEAEAFKYFTQTLQAIHYLHSSNVIHRDIKPENLLLDSVNNIKLCDFGWCAEDKSMKRNTFCGTYEYMAPEMLFKGEYDYRVDVWALGILLYEMLHGHAPFKGKSSAQVKESMLRGAFEISDHLSQEVKKLISHLLQFNPDKRISTEECFKSAWVKNMEISINNSLKLDSVSTPKETHDKIIEISNKNSEKKIKTGNVKHRKNNSMNVLEDSTCEQINLQHFIKLNKPKRYFHSQEKETDQFYAKQMDYCPSVPKQLLDSTNKTSTSDLHQKVHQKSKTMKLKCRQKKADNPCESLSKKKFKLRNSQVQQISQKFPVRFNTEMYDKQDFEPMRMKKSNAKNKFLTNSKSTLLKMSKSGKIQERVA